MIIKMILFIIGAIGLYLFGGLPLTIIGVGSIGTASLLWWLSKKFKSKQKEVVIKKKPNSDGTPFLDVRHTPKGVEGIHIGMNNKAEPMQGKGKEVIDLTEVTQDLVILETARANARTEEARAKTAQACKEIAQTDISPFERNKLFQKLLPPESIGTTTRRKKARKPRLSDDISGINQYFDT